MCSFCDRYEEQEANEVLDKKFPIAALGTMAKYKGKFYLLTTVDRPVYYWKEVKKKENNGILE